MSTPKTTQDAITGRGRPLPEEIQHMSKKIYLFVLTIVTIALGACAPSPATIVAPLQDEQEAPPTILVTGIGEASGTPDQATVQLGVNV